MRPEAYLGFQKMGQNCHWTLVHTQGGVGGQTQKQSFQKFSYGENFFLPKNSQPVVLQYNVTDISDINIIYKYKPNTIYIF